MSYKLSLRVKLIGIAATISLFGTITVAKAGSVVKRDLPINTVAQNYKPKAEAYGISAQQKYSKQEYQGALDDINRAIQLDPNSSFAYAWRCFLKADKFQDNQGALNDINRAIQLDSSNGLTYFMRGNLKTNKLHDIRGGLDDYNRAIQLNPTNAIVYSYRGALKGEKLQDNRGALADFNQAIQIDPKLAVAYNNRAILKYEHLNNPAGGIADIHQAARLFQQEGRQVEAQSAISLLKKWQGHNKKISLSY